MSDRLKLAREIATRTKPRFIEIKREKRSTTMTEEPALPLGGALRMSDKGTKRHLEFGTSQLAQ